MKIETDASGNYIIEDRKEEEKKELIDLKLSVSDVLDRINVIKSKHKRSVDVENYREIIAQHKYYNIIKNEERLYIGTDLHVFFLAEYFKYLAKCYSKKYSVQFHFIPQTQNFINARSVFQYLFEHSENEEKKNSWQIVRLQKIAEVNSTCEACKEKKDKLDVHEFWNFDVVNRLQILKEIIALCSECHSVVHVNRFKGVNTKDKFAELFLKYCRLNKVSEKEAREDFEIEEKRRDLLNAYQYDVNIDLLFKYLRYNREDVYINDHHKKKFVVDKFFKDYIVNEFSQAGQQQRGNGGKGVNNRRGVGK